MNAHLKAIELIRKFSGNKDYALIVVNEILDANSKDWAGYSYWMEVKLQIEDRVKIIII
jgi:hypothetical protein